MVQQIGENAQAPTRDPKWWTLTAVCIGVFMLLLDITIVNVALPDIQSELDASLSDLQWVIDAYALSLAALLLTAGSLADLFGRRRLFVIGLVVFTAGSVDSLNHISLIAAVVAFSSGVLSLLLIRQKDFVVRTGPGPAEPAESPSSVPG